MIIGNVDVQGILNQAFKLYQYEKLPKVIPELEAWLTREFSKVVPEFFHSRIKFECMIGAQYNGHIDVVARNSFTQALLNGVIDTAPEPEPIAVTAHPQIKTKDASNYEGMRAQLVAQYGPKLGTFLTNRLATAIRKTKATCLSHLRIARAHKPDELNNFYRIRNEGCCGSYEDWLVYKHYFLGIPIRTEYILIGFNYGH